MGVPVVKQRQVPSIQKIQKTVEVPQVQYVDRIVDVPVVKQRQVPAIQKLQKTVEVPQVQYIDRVVAAPAVTTIPTTTMVAPLVEAFAAPMPTTYGVLPAYGTSTFATAGSATCRFCGNTYMDDSVYCRKCGQPRS